MTHLRGIRDSHYKCDLETIEIGFRGYIKNKTKAIPQNLFKSFGVRKTSDPIKLISKLALIGSFVIYISREDPVWVDINLLKL